MIYAGWVPNVSGHLSFSSIGESIYPNRTSCVSDSTRIFCTQTRDLLDVIAPFGNETAIGSFFQEFVANLVVGVSGQFDFFLLGELSEDKETLVGQIVMIPRKGNKIQIRNIHKLLKKWKLDEDWPADVVESLFQDLKPISCANAKFELYRNGRVIVNLELPKEDEPIDSSLARMVANQIFYFLKDNSHVHQHHDPSHDAITTISPIDDHSDHSWVRETQNALYRSVVRFKRYRNERALFRASGVLAYAQSFEASFQKHDQLLRTYNHANLSSSLAVAREEIKHFDSKRSSFIETIRNFFFAAIGLVISIVLILKLDQNFSTDVPNELKIAIGWILGNPFFVGTVLILLSFIYAIATHRTDPAEWRFIRNLLRLFQGFRLRWFFIFNILVVTVLSYICFRLLSLLT
jgi:hypothetical protein